jgi:DNA-binding beta-propeller fold protein YncE
VLETISVGSQPTFVAVDPVLNNAFVINSSSNNVYVVNGENEHGIVGIIPVQDTPYGLTVDREHHWLYVTNTDAHSISIVDARSHQILTTTPTQEFPLDVAVNPKNNMLYVIHRDQPAIFVVQIVSE